MIQDTTQSAKSGDNANILQANTINIGITYSEARNIAQDVCNSNILKYSADAFKTAEGRFKELMDAFFERLPKDKPELLERFKDP
jgi:hypothetical protein